MFPGLHSNTSQVFLPLCMLKKMIQIFVQSLMSLHLRYYLVKLDRRQEGQERFPIVLPFHLASFIIINGPICALHQWSGAVCDGSQQFEFYQ